MAASRLRTAALATCGLVIAASVGCSGSSMEATVSGVVKLDGQPVGPGTVVFAPVGGQSNPADGAILPDGTYFLKTSRQVGLKPGQYQASVTVLDQPAVRPGERSMVAAKLVTPEKYADPKSSGLSYSVDAGENTIDIDLKSK